MRLSFAGLLLDLDIMESFYLGQKCFKLESVAAVLTVSNVNSLIPLEHHCHPEPFAGILKFQTICKSNLTKDESMHQNTAIVAMMEKV